MENKCNFSPGSGVYICRKHARALKRAALLLCLMLIFALTGCLSEEQETLYPLSASPVNLDPQLAQGEDTDFVIRHLFEGLVAVLDGEIVPAAAERWEVSDDGMQYIFTLRADGSWSDGEPLTAADFVYAFTRLFDPATHAPAASDFTAIKGAQQRLDGEDVPLGVQAKGTTLTFTLSHPDNRFLYLLTTAPASPCREDYFLGTHGRYGLERNAILGNGPFYLSTWDADYLRLRGRQGTAAAETVLRLDIGGEASDAVWELADGEGESLVYGLLFNETDELFSEKAVRQALFYDLPETPEAPLSILSPALREGMDALQLPQQDIAMARSLFKSSLSAAGDAVYGRSVLISEESGLSEAFSALAQVWQRDLGLYLAVEILPEAELESRVETGNFDCALTVLPPDYAHPAGVLSHFVSDSRENFCGYDSEDYDALFAQAVRENDPDTAAKLYEQAEQLLADDAVFLPLFTLHTALRTEAAAHSANPCGREVTFS